MALSANHACKPNVKAVGYFWRDMLIRIESEWDVAPKHLVKSARIGRPLMSESLESWVHGPGRQVYESGPRSIFTYHRESARRPVEETETSDDDEMSDMEARDDRTSKIRSDDAPRRLVSHSSKRPRPTKIVGPPAQLDLMHTLV